MITIHLANFLIFRLDRAISWVVFKKADLTHIAIIIIQEILRWKSIQTFCRQTLNQFQNNSLCGRDLFAFESGVMQPSSITETSDAIQQQERNWMARLMKQPRTCRAWFKQVI